PLDRARDPRLRRPWRAAALTEEHFDGEVVERPDERVRELERLLVGRESRVRDRDDAHPCGLRRADSGVRVLDRCAACWMDSKPSSRLEVDVGRWLAALDLLGRHGRAEASGETGEPQYLLEHLPV